MNLLCLPFILLTFISVGQTDFSNYTTLQSKGNIPKEFTIETFSKLEADLKEGRSELSKAEQKIFLEGTNYAIDDILHSGLVVYGDEVTLYVTDVADKLLKNDPELKSKLRFYTLKTNVANAFSTDQGIIFVTTGLIAQLTNEAQLAFILAHEISHYTENHVIESFDWKLQNRYDENGLEKLSQYSKNHELEADKLGVKLYYEAGYSADAIFSTFDVLMYSYLPFDEVEFPKTYFNSNDFFIPEKLFPNKKYPITAEEDYDDQTSSHPNIKKRKDSIEVVIGSYRDWGNSIEYLGQTRFENVRNICRFENVRSDILNANYGDALYSIFLLERSFPNSMYLKRMKAQTWFNLLVYKEENIAGKAVKKSNELEGESATLHYLLKKLSRDALFTLALREIYDLRMSYSDDAEILAVYNRAVKELAFNEKFKIENFSTKSFDQAAQLAIQVKDSLLLSNKDSLKVEGTSKYDKIKKKKTYNNSAEFDSTKFYLYGMIDVMQNEEFLGLHSKYKKLYDQENIKNEENSNLSEKQKKQQMNLEEDNQLKIGITDLIVVEPLVQVYNSQGVDRVQSEKLEKSFSEMIQNSAKDLGMQAYSIDSRTLSSKGTVGYNERSTLLSFLSQISQEKNVDAFPVDYQLLNEIKQNYGTSKIMFSLVEHIFDIDINWWAVGFSAIIYPTLPYTLFVYIPSRIFKGNHTEMNIVILDTDMGKIQTGKNFSFNEPIRKLNFGAHTYDIFHQLKSNPL